MTLTKQIIKSQYSNIEELKKYAAKIFSRDNNITIMKNDIVPKNYKENFKKPFKDLTYDELSEVVIFYDKKYESEQNIRNKKRKDNVHTIKEYKDEPFKIKYSFDNNNEDYSYLLGVFILIIVIIIVTYIIFKSIMKSK